MAQLKDLLVDGKSRFIDKIYASDQFISKVVQGTSPFSVDSSTLVTNLNADLLDGYHYSAFSLSTHTHTWVGDGTNKLYAELNNEINFGGTNTGTTMYFSYRAKDSRPIITSFVFGGSNGSATLKAKQFISSATQGTAPVKTDSSTLCTNLNADLLDGFHAADFRNNIIDLRAVPQTFNPTYLKDIVFIAESDYSNLLSNGTITKNGITHTYNKSNWYITDKIPELADHANSADYASQAGYASSVVVNNSPGGFKYVIRSGGIGSNSSLYANSGFVYNSSTNTLVLTPGDTAVNANDYSFSDALYLGNSSTFINNDADMNFHVGSSNYYFYGTDENEEGDTYDTGYIKGRLSTKYLIPILEKTYANYTCSANDTNNAYLFFGNVIIDTSLYGDPWEVHYTLTVDSSVAYCQGEYDVIIGCAGSNYFYHIFNKFYSGSYYPIYHHYYLYHNTEEKFNNRAAHPPKLGVRVYSSYAVTTVARTYTIKVWRCLNCHVNFPSSIEKYSSVYNSTYYNGLAISAISLGLQETGDADTTNSLQLTHTRIKAGTGGIKQYSLIMMDASGNWQSFITGTGGNGTANKTKNTAGFVLGSPIYYVSRSSDLAAGSLCSHYEIRAYQCLIDVRYSFKDIVAGGAGLTCNKPMYLVGSLGTDGLFYIDDTMWSQEIPAVDNGKIYIKLSEGCYQDYGENTTKNYRIDFIPDGTAYHYKNGKIQKFVKATDLRHGGWCSGNGSYWGKVAEYKYTGTSTVDVTASFLISIYGTTVASSGNILAIRCRGASKSDTKNISANYILKTGEYSVKVTHMYDADAGAYYIRIYTYSSGWGNSLGVRLLNSHSWSANTTDAWTMYDATYTGGRVESFSAVPTVEGEEEVTIGVSAILNSPNQAYLPLAGGTMTGAGPINFTRDKIAINFRPDSASYYSKVQYMTTGNEALVFSNKNAVTSFIFKCGLDLAAGANWNSQFNATDKRPSVQIKNQSLYVNSFINTGVTPAYNFYVDGSSGFTGQIISSVAQGTAPIVVDSSTLVTNLNADYLDGLHANQLVPRQYNIRFYPFIKADDSRSIWHKVTFPHTGYTSSSNAWFMLSMEIVLGGVYTSATTGKIFLSYYFLKNSSNVWTASNVKGIAIGTHITSSGVTIKYDIANPAIFYIKVSPGNYTSFAIENLSANDTAQNFDYRNTTIEAIAEADIPSTATNVVPIASIETTDGSTLTASNLTATIANKVKTIKSTSTANHYLTFVDSNNDSSTDEFLYTTAKLYIQPSTGNIITDGYVAVGTGKANSYIGSDSASNIWIHNSSGYALVCDANIVRRGASMTTGQLGSSTYPWANTYTTKITTANYEISESTNNRLSVGNAGQTTAKGLNVGNLLVSSAWADYTNVPTNGIYSKGQIKIGVAQGTAPLAVDSSTLNSNLNADYLDGEHKYQIRAYPRNNSSILFSTLPYLIDGKSILGAGTPIVSMEDAPEGVCWGPITTYKSFYSDYIEVQPGEVLYGEIWAYRASGASGTAGTLYYGIDRYDRNKNAIASNTGCTYFVASGSTVAADGVWHKYSATTTIPTSHTVYNGSDGKGVYYIKIRILVNYSAGTVPTYIGRILLSRKVQSAINADTAASADTISGILPISKGGTDSSTAAGARANLGTWSLVVDSYNTLMPADGTTNAWVKIGTANTSYGLLPSQSGARGSGHNYLGTSSWYWKYGYIDEMYISSMNINNKLVIDNSGRIIPYDSSTSRAAGNYGYYDSTLLGHIWSIGTSYSISTNGKSPNTLYGLAYFHTNWSNGTNNDGTKTAKGTYAGGHQVAWFNNGVLASAMGDNFYTKGQFISKKAQGTAPLVVDSSTMVTNLQSNYAKYAEVLRDPSYYTFSTRRTSANINWADGGLHYFLATSSMTTGKPAGDGHILHMAWDNGKWEGQLTLPTGDTGSMQWRTQANSDSWGPWKTILDSSNYSTYITTTDKYVEQSATTTANYRGIVLGYNSNASANTGITTTVTNVVYTTNNLTVQPSTGNIVTKGYVAVGTGGTNSYLGSDSASNICLHNSSGYALVCNANVVRRGTSMSTGQLGEASYPWAKVYSNQEFIFQTTNSALGIATSSPWKIGLGVKDLHIRVANGSGTGVNDGYAGGITFGNTDGSTYAGIYYQSSSSYGSRLIFGTTNSYANGAYGRVIINHAGDVGIGTMSPSQKLHVTGTIYSSVAQGTAPLKVDSSTMVTNLYANYSQYAVNADKIKDTTDNEDAWRDVLHFAESTGTYRAVGGDMFYNPSKDTLAIGNYTGGVSSFVTATRSLVVGTNITVSGSNVIASGESITATSCSDSIIGGSLHSITGSSLNNHFLVSGTSNTITDVGTVAAIGYKLSLTSSVAIGCMAIGQYNNTTYSASSPLFVIGSGTADDARSNIFEVNSTTASVLGNVKAYSFIPRVASTSLSIGNSATPLDISNGTLYYVAASGTTTVTVTFTWNNAIEGEERHIVIYSASTKTLNIGDVNSSSTNTMKNQSSIKISSGKFGEVNILYLNSNYYIRSNV